MIFETDHTHDPSVQSWVTSANAPGTEFPIQNLPLGVFSTADGKERRIGIAIGDQILGIGAALDKGLLSGLEGLSTALRSDSLNLLMSSGRAARQALRNAVFTLLRADSGHAAAAGACLVAMRDAQLHLPAQIGNFTDFFTSIHHARRTGELFRRLLLHGAERMDRDMKAHLAGDSGQVRVLASASSMMGPLVPDVASFLRKRANIHVDMEEASTPQVVEGVRQGLATLGVGWTAVDFSDMEVVPYRSDELCVVVPPGHRLAKRARVRFGELLPYELVAQPANSTLQVLMHQLAANAGVVLQQRIVAHSYHTVLRVVQAGLAFAVVPRAVAQLTGSAMGLKQVDLDEPWAVRQFVICHRGEEAMTPAAKLLLEHLRQVSSA